MGRCFVVAAALAVATHPSGAEALEPLSAYLQAAQRNAPELAEVEAEGRASDEETQAARARFFPGLSARGSYTRNQFNIAPELPQDGGGFEAVTFMPRNQLDATFRVEIPLLDMGAVRSLQAAKAEQDAASARTDDMALELAGRVCTAYTGVIAYEALARAARKSIEAAEANTRVVESRLAAGLASDLDTKRASALLDAARQVLADAELERRSAERQLEALTGLPVQTPIPEPEVDMRPEAPLSSWLTGLDELPQSRLARADVEAAEASRRASRADLIPALSAHAEERLTNAAGFAEPAMWAVGVTLTAQLEVAAVRRARAGEARVQARAARLDRTRRDQRLEIENAHDRVGSTRVKAEAAQSEAESAQAALEVAQSRYAAGTASQLDVVQALRDQFRASARLIQAHAELTLARIQLRLAAGRDPVGGA